MRLNTALSLIALAAPTFTHGFTSAGRRSATRTATSLAARRSMFPILRRSDLFFPDIDEVFNEMDEMMETSFSRFPRLPSLMERSVPGEMSVRRPLGFEVTQDETEYKVQVHVPDVDPQDVSLQLDHDGRVLRLKGDRTHEEGGMQFRSHFEKAILLSSDVDTTKLAANMSGDTLTVVAPKIERKAVLEAAEDKKIEIKITDAPKAALDDHTVDDTPKAPTKLAVESLKDEEVTPENTKGSVKGEKAFIRDFPY